MLLFSTKKNPHPNITTTTTKQMENHSNTLNSESLKVDLKYTRERQSTRQTKQTIKVY